MAQLDWDMTKRPLLVCDYLEILLSPTTRLNTWPLCICLLYIVMHTLDVSYPFVPPTKRFTPSIYATSTSWDLAPEVRFVGGVQSCIMPTKLSPASKGLASAPLSITHKLAIAEHGTDSWNEVFCLDARGFSVAELAVFLLSVCCVA